MSGPGRLGRVLHFALTCLCAGSKWTRKLKPEYAAGASQNLDVVVLGGYYGVGTRRAKGLSHFLLGVALTDPTSAAVGAPRKFIPFGELAALLCRHCMHPPHTSRACPTSSGSQGRLGVQHGGTQGAFLSSEEGAVA